MPEKSSDLTDKGIYLLFGEIDTDLSRDVVSYILEMNYFKNTVKHLTFIVNSPGGSVTAAFAIIDAMNGSQLPIHTVGIGQVSSAGLSIFISGEKGHRVLTKNTSILCHQFSWGSEGKNHELLSRVKEFDLTTARIMDHYKLCTGLTEKIIKEKLMPESDVWLSAEEAKKYKLCDKIKELGKNI